MPFRSAVKRMGDTGGNPDGMVNYEWGRIRGLG
jgi:hypothetical protein